jgi:hypothetical protein
VGSGAARRGVATGGAAVGPARVPRKATGSGEDHRRRRSIGTTAGDTAAGAGIRGKSLPRLRDGTN